MKISELDTALVRASSFEGKKGQKVARTPKDRESQVAPVDAKGRVVVPKDVRRHLERLAEARMAGSGDASRLVLTRYKDPCVLVYPEFLWDTVLERVHAAKNKAVERIFIGSYREAELDGFGRIVIPGDLAKHARINGKAYFVKTTTGFEIWDPEVYKEVVEGSLEELPDLGELGV